MWYEGIIPPPIEERNVSKDCIIVYANGFKELSRYRKWNDNRLEWDGSKIFGEVILWMFVPPVPSLPINNG